MCGRFTQMMSWSEVHDLYRHQKPTAPVSMTPRYNGAPSQDFAACRLDTAGRRTVVKLRWGLVPSWARDVRIGSRLINARAETVHSKPSFGAAFRSRRCLVPANGWFEWRKEGRNKQPYFLALADGSPLSFAGLWECWSGPDECPGDVHHHHDGVLCGTRRHLSPATRHRRPRPIRRLARSGGGVVEPPRPGSAALCRTLREAPRRHPGEQRPEQPSGHPLPGARAGLVLRSSPTSRQEGGLSVPPALPWERRLSSRR